MRVRWSGVSDMALRASSGARSPGQGTGRRRDRREFGIRHSNSLEPDRLRPLPEHGLAQLRQPIQPGCQRDEMVAGELTHLLAKCTPP